MKLKVMALVVMLGIVGRVDAGSEFDRASVLLTKCESENVGVRNDCLSYIAGVVDTFEAFDALWMICGDMANLVCISQDVNLTQMREVYIKYANEHPEQLHLPASIMVLESLGTAFPCE